MRRIPATLAVVLAILLPGTPAWAHTGLVSSDPAKDATLGRAPASVTLTFGGRINPDFTTIVVSDEAKQRIPASAPADDDRSSTVSLTQPLNNGAYTVAYRVVSVDGHTVQGSYVFTVADPARPAAAAVPAVSPGAAAAGAESGGISTAVLIGLGVFGMLAVLAAAYLYVSGRRRAVPASPR
jgi:methionine-rich copper-binding protein CopC